MAKKFYVIWQGAKTGVFQGDWSEIGPLVQGQPGAKYKGFKTRSEADSAWKQGAPSPARRKPGAKNAAKKKSAEPASGALLDGYNYPLRQSQQARVKIMAKGPFGDQAASLSIFCDGACVPNPGQAGSGMAVYQQGKLAQLWYGLYDARGTNNTAELKALYGALRFARHALSLGKPHIEVLSDSTYALKTLLEWSPGWKKKGWTRGKKDGQVQEVKNLDLVKALYELYYGELEGKIRLGHVKGHADVEGNELADRMAMLARKQKQPKLCEFKETLDVGTILAMEEG